MSKKNLTRRALFASVISLILCCAMLVGTTFAWFTDAAASASNVIQSGNLDIVVEYTLDGETWNPLDGATDLFQKDLWEPGHTEVVALRISNEGSLALKYTANMNIVEEVIGKNKNDEDIVLSDVLQVSTLVQQANDDMGVGAIALMLAFNGENSVSYENTATFKAGNVLRDNVELHPGVEHYMIVKVDMPETVGNEANHNGTDVPSINFGINVMATQYTYENDSFGNDYDEDASTDDVKIEKNITLEEDSTDKVEVSANEDVEIDLNNQSQENVMTNNGKMTVSNGTIDYTDGRAITNNGDATFTNVDMNIGSASDYGFVANSGSVTTMNDVNIASNGGAIGATNGAQVEFNSGSVAVVATTTNPRYNIYAVGEGTVVTINGGTFSFSSLTLKRAYIYAGSGATVYVKGGTFGAASTRSGYTAGIMGDGTVIITGGTFGFDPSAWVAEGYQAVQSGDTWTVSATGG